MKYVSKDYTLEGSPEEIKEFLSKENTSSKKSSLSELVIPLAELVYEDWLDTEEREKKKLEVFISAIEAKRNILNK